MRKKEDRRSCLFFDVFPLCEWIADEKKRVRPLESVLCTGNLAAMKRVHVLTLGSLLLFLFFLFGRRAYKRKREQWSDNADYNLFFFLSSVFSWLSLYLGAPQLLYSTHTIRSRYIFINWLGAAVPSGAEGDEENGQINDRSCPASLGCERRRRRRQRRQDLADWIRGLASR